MMYKPDITQTYKTACRYPQLVSNLLYPVDICHTVSINFCEIQFLCNVSFPLNGPHYVF